MRAREARTFSPNASRSDATAARHSVVRAATAMNSCVLTTLCDTEWNTNAPR